MERDLTLGGERTMPCAEEVLLRRTLEPYMVLLTSATPIIQ